MIDPKAEPIGNRSPYKRVDLGARRLGPKCTKCDGCGWVCENHPEMPWLGIANRGCECGAGMPCSCNRASPPWNFGA